MSSLSTLATFALSRRLQEHAKSIISVDSLAINDFSCRILIVDDIWIPLGESLVIDRFKPLWNVSLDGFGNHDPGGGRYKGKRPAWDEIHPGRSWAVKCEPAKVGADELLRIIGNHMDSL